MKLRARAFGSALGVVFGLGVFLATLFSVWFGRGLTLSSLEVVCPGYTVSYLGAFIGLVWGVVCGFVGGALLAWFYNLFHRAFYGSEATGGRV